MSDLGECFRRPPAAGNEDVVLGLVPKVITEIGRLLAPGALDLEVFVQQHKAALGVAVGVAHGTDHDLARAKAVARVQVGQAGLLLNLLGLHNL